ncbi:helix-turn-helix transcriptional regulator [Thiolapillus sp.]|uniref:helix-turn-helix transcriptional regulator n=1 Tax=Thiolapillus sp. TaxID=2017437 RepID=UPI003AF6AC51
MNHYELKAIKNRELVQGVMYIFAEDVRNITKLGRTTIYQLIKEGKFPKPIDGRGYRGERQGNNKRGKLQLWRSSEIYNWMETMADKRGSENEPKI